MADPKKFKPLFQQPIKMKLVQAWIGIHQDELIADWQLASNGENVLWNSH
jgi:hypothetical protein